MRTTITAPIPGKVLYEHLPAELKSRICFQENDWSVLESGSWRKDCELLILNLIATTCNLPHPGPGAEKSGPGNGARAEEMF